MRESLGVPAAWTAWTSKATVRGVPKSDRCRAIVDLAWAARLQEARRAADQRPTPELAKGWWCNPSQSLKRAPWGKHPGTLLQGSCMYSYELDVAFSGYDSLLVHGFPSDVAPRNRFSERDLKSLAGESFFLPCITSVVYAYFLNPGAPWWRK